MQNIQQRSFLKCLKSRTPPLRNHFLLIFLLTSNFYSYVFSYTLFAFFHFPELPISFHAISKCHEDCKSWKWDKLYAKQRQVNQSNFYNPFHRIWVTWHSVCYHLLQAEKKRPGSSHSFKIGLQDRSSKILAENVLGSGPGRFQALKIFKYKSKLVSIVSNQKIAFSSKMGAFTYVLSQIFSLNLLDLRYLI